MKHLCSLIISFCLFQILNAQPSSIWTRTYGSSYIEAGNYVQQTSDGGFIVAGLTEKLVMGWSGAGWLIRTNAQGDTLWTRTYGGCQAVDECSAQQTSDSGFVMVARHYYGGDERGYDLLLIRTDAMGDTLWTRSYHSSLSDVGYSVQQTSDGGFVVVGKTALAHDNVLLVRTDAQGDTLWTRTYGGSNSDAGYFVQQTSDSGFVIVGEASSFGAGECDVWLIRTDAQGDTLWTRTFGGSGVDHGYSVQLTSDSGFVMVGETSSFGAGETDVWLIRTDAQGDTLWARTYGGSNNDVGYSVQHTADSGFVLVGQTNFVGSPDYSGDLWLIHTDAQGDTIWTRTYGGNGDDCGYSVQQTSDGGFIVAGETSSFGSGWWSNVWLIKTDSLGNTAPLPLSVRDEEPGLPEAYALEQNYPNPFNPVSTIQYDLPQGSKVSLIVYDILGREVAKLVNAYMEPGYHQIQWDGRDVTGRELPSGIYIARLRCATPGKPGLVTPPAAGQAPEYNKSIKMVLLR
jgi:hypothetical protein